MKMITIKRNVLELKHLLKVNDNIPEGDKKQLGIQAPSEFYLFMKEA
ncbi:MAG: hypothetical protein OQK98_14025 [Gammaproteobacteria bacterium]|nr:hypothetical protein [Gammaproteobacteria bacterium]